MAQTKARTDRAGTAKGSAHAIDGAQLEVRRDRFSEMTDEELDYFIATGEEMPKGVVKPGNA